ncbi:MAG: host-nuclease inhibitor Gam family protein [Pseudomonadota bacterium]
MARRKQQSVAVPASEAEAIGMIGDYIKLERRRAVEELSAEAAIDQVKRKRDEELAQIDEEAKELFSGLKSWWEAGGADLLRKGRRSAEIANAKIGLRLTPPAVKLKRKVKLADVVAWLRKLRWSRKSEFLRIKVSLDKEAVIKAAQAEPDIAKTFENYLSVDQVDEFFIDTKIDRDAIKKEIAE